MGALKTTDKKSELAPIGKATSPVAAKKEPVEADRPPSRTRNKLAAAVSASDSDVSETIHKTETKIEGLLNNDRPPSQNGSSNGDRPRSRNRALAAVADSKEFAVPSPKPTAASPVQTSLVKSLELERDELKKEVARLRTSSDNGDAHERLKAAEEACESRCRAAEERAKEAERTCEERCASMDEMVKKLEADLARDFAASKAVETCLDERNLELKAEKRKSESLQAALDAAQKVEPTGDDEADKLRESLPRAAALQRELDSVKKDAEEIAQHAAEQTRRREAAETASQELKAERDTLQRDLDKAKELTSAKETALTAQIALVKTLQEELAVARSARDASQQSLREAEARASQARAEVTETRSELSKARTDDTADRRAREAEARLELLERDRRDERKALEDAKSRSDARLRALEERAESSKRAENDARATIDDLRRQLDDRSTNQDSALRDRALHAEDEAKCAKRRADSADRARDEALEQCSDAEERLAASEQEVRKMKAEARDMARKLSDAEDRATELEKEQTWKQEKLDKLSQRADGEAAKRVSAERDLASLRASVDGGGGDAVLVESLRLRAEKAESERDAATKRALHLETELARARTQAPTTPGNDDRAARSARRERDAAVDALRNAEAALRQATGAPQESPRSRVDDERSALREAQELVKKQRAWLKERQRQLEEKRTAWRSKAALRGNGSTRERQHLDREASDLNKLVRQLRKAQSWIEDRDAKVRRVEAGASPLAELDLLDDDTFCSSVSETPYRRRGRRHRRAPEVHYGMYDPYRPPQAFYYAPPMMMPPPPPRPTDDYYQQAQAQAPSNIHWAQPPPPPPPAPQPTMATPLRDWAANRDHAQGRVHSHVKWLDGLRNELTQHCYGKPEPEVVGVPGDAALDAAVEARLRG